MRLRIKKARNRTVWYANRVGDEFECAGETSSGKGYLVCYNGTCLDYGVFKGDCEILDGPAKGESDSVSHPSHYTAGEIEVIDIIAQTVAGYDDPFVGHCIGTATKYLNRAPYKHASPLEDLKKSRAYIDFAIEHMESAEFKR